MTAPRSLRFGTRGSRLALAQAEIVRRALEGQADGWQVELVPVRTRGDDLSRRRPSGSFIATDGQFTSELERLVADGQIDAAVHSLKDLPTASNPELGIAAVLPREDARDCLLTFDDRDWRELPEGATVGTTSPRRVAQLAALRGGLVAVPIRGNVETRLRRMRTGQPMALLMAVAGLERLGIPFPDRARLSLDEMLPAPGQAAIAIQSRRDHPAWSWMARADHAETRLAVEAERALLQAIGGGCLAPLGAYAVAHDGQVTLSAAFEDSMGEVRRAQAAGSAGRIDAIVSEVAERLLAERMTLRLSAS